METANIISTLGHVRANSIDVENRTVQFIISDETRDRDGTVIRISAWRFDNYNKNPIVAYQHETGKWWKEEQNPDYIIGIGRVWKEDDLLIGEAKFEPADVNPLADKVFKKIQHGTLRATSVGFLPFDGNWGKIENGEDSGTYYFTDVDLLEFSVVNIPSNPNAVVRSINDNSIKSFIDSQKKEKQTEHQSDENKPSGSLAIKKARLQLLTT